MECRYCRAQNAEDDHRCQRCGRRLRMTPVYTGQSAAAPELQFETSRPETAPEPRIAAEESRPRLQVVSYQPMLFSSRELSEATTVEMQPSRKPDIPDARPANTRPRARKISSGQQNLEFNSGSMSSPAVPHSAEPVIYCDAPVAIAAHRLIAAAYDGAIVLVALGVFLGIFQLSCTLWAGGPALVLNKQSLPLLGGIAVVFALLYNVLFALANGDTPGKLWARLRLVNFEGRTPDREQRLYRLASGCLSLMAAGLGILWALVDEEALTWHDHMSKTFPTPY
jgi:uncharacterized RDD family membrane protein YckC